MYTIYLVQVRNVANLFSLDPQSIYLTEEVDGLVLFPMDNGKFKANQIIIGATYVVHGNQTSSSSEATSSHSASPLMPYGAYTSCTYSQFDPPPPHPPRSLKSNEIKKNILVVSLSKKGKERAKQHLEYTTVTQIVISLSPSQCSVPAIAQIVTQQVGFQVILLDSKCYPLLSSEGTSGTECWKSTRKILAASKSLYERVSGMSTKGDIADRAAIDLTMDNEPGPSKKKVCTGANHDDQCLQVVIDKISRVEKRLDFLDELSQSFQCVICQTVVKFPVVSPCCQRLLGCESCIKHWFDTKSACPLCNAAGSDMTHFRLRGFDDAIKVLHILKPDPDMVEEKQEERLHTEQRDSDSDFEDLPPFPLSRSDHIPQ